MTINNLKSFVGSLWDWSILDNCFSGTNIKVSDIDGIVERNGMFLVLEAKRTGVSIPRGQQILLEQLSKKKGFTIIVVWGKPNRVEEMMIYTPKRVIPKKPATNKDFQKAVSYWFSCANQEKG